MSKNAKELKNGPRERSEFKMPWEEWLIQSLKSQTQLKKKLRKE